MKSIMMGLAVSALASLSTSAVAALGDPVEVSAPIEKIFIPQGFDDNDNVEVIIHGNFPDTCYTVGRTGASLDPVTKKITVSATAFKYPGKICLQTITPFIQSVSLGVIPSGNYQVVFADNKEVTRSLEVAQRKTESADDFLYASVENASIEVDAATGKQRLKISGHYPHFFVGCMVLREVRTQLAPEDVIVVLPISEVVGDQDCQDQASDKAFEYTVGLQSPFRGQGLLHVRTLNGNSINRYINVQ